MMNSQSNLSEKGPERDDICMIAAMVSVCYYDNIRRMSFYRKWLEIIFFGPILFTP